MAKDKLYYVQEYSYPVFQAEPVKLSELERKRKMRPDKKGNVPDSISNERIVDDTNFLSLEAKIQRYKLAGLAMQAERTQFTYEDFDEIYLDLPMVEQDDDIIEVREKLLNIQNLVRERQLKILERKNSETSSIDKSIQNDVNAIQDSDLKEEQKIVPPKDLKESTEK